MKSRYLRYYESVVRPGLICQYNYNNDQLVPKLLGIKLGFSFTNLAGEEDIKLAVAIKFLSVITGRKPGVTKLKWSAAGGRERRLLGSCWVTLRGNIGYDFLEYLVQVVLPLYNRRYGRLECKVSESGVCSFVFGDLSVFYRQNEDLIGFPGKLIVSIETTGKSKDEVRSLVESLGIK
jgi:ribosomal protein L5